jgi:hypothetical protein
VSGWDTQDIDLIVQKRRMRGGSRRRSGRGWVTWLVAGLGVLVLGAGAYLFLTRNASGLAALPNPAIEATDGFNATIGGNNTVTIGLGIRNRAAVPVTVLSARIIAPTGLTRTALTIIPPGNENQGFALDGTLPSPQTIQLGTDPATSDAVIAARYTVNCRALLAANADVDEAIYVTIEVDGQQREEELTPPVVDDKQWLSASAQRVCLNPVPTGGSTDQPLPPQPGGTPPAQ